MKEIYILTNLDGTHRGVYNSVDDLITGVDLWITKEPEESLIYEEWYLPGAQEITWKYAYVSTHDHPKAYYLSADHQIDEEFPWDNFDRNLVSHPARKKNEEANR
jgi:hypothetical protein